MPTRPYTVRELEDSEMLGELAMAIASDDEDSSDEELVDALLLGLQVEAAPVRALAHRAARPGDGRHGVRQAARLPRADWQLL